MWIHALNEHEAILYLARTKLHMNTSNPQTRTNAFIRWFYHQRRSCCIYFAMNRRKYTTKQRLEFHRRYIIEWAWSHTVPRENRFTPMTTRNPYIDFCQKIHVSQMHFNQASTKSIGNMIPMAQSRQLTMRNHCADPHFSHIFFQSTIETVAKREHDCRSSSILRVKSHARRTRSVFEIHRELCICWREERRQQRSE